MHTDVFISDHRRALQIGLSTVPVAIESGILIYKAVKNRKAVAAAFQHSTHEIRRFFERRVNQETGEPESNLHYRLRIAGAVSITAIAITAITGATVAVWVALPSMVAFPIAISIIGYSTKAVVYRHSIKETFANGICNVKDAFTPREDEDAAQATKRIVRNAVVTALFATIVVGTGVTTATLGSPMFGLSVAMTTSSLLLTAFAKREDLKYAFYPRSDEERGAAARRIAKNVFLLTVALSIAGLVTMSFPGMEDQYATLFGGSQWPHLVGTNTVILGEYFILAALHIGRATHALYHKNYAEAAFHFANAIEGFGLPAHRMLLGESMRLHHDFQGLALALAPFRALQLFGAGYTIDSTMYYIENRQGKYDYANLFVDDTQNIIWGLSIGCLLQELHNMIPTTKPQPADMPGCIQHPTTSVISC